MNVAPPKALSPRHAALAARGWDGDDRRILGWEAAFRQRVNDLRDDAGLQFLNNYLLAPGDWTALVVLRPSWSAFQLLDHWFPTSFTEILAQAELVNEPLSIGPGSNIFQRAISAYPVLALLSQQHPSTDTGGVQVAKALVLGAMFQGSMLATAGAIRECADGLRKSLSRADWRALVAWEDLEYGDDLARTLDGAQRLLDGATVRAIQDGSDAHGSFLSALREVLAAVRTGGARLPTAVALGVNIDLEDDDARPERPLRVQHPDLSDQETDQQDRDVVADGSKASTAGEAREEEQTAPADVRSSNLGGETDAHAEFRALRTGFLAAITNQYLAVDHDQLLDHELKAFVRALKSALGAERDIGRRAAALLTMSLCTGETVTSILESRIEPTVRPGFRANGRWVRVVRPEPDSKVAPRAVRKFLARHGDRFELAAPAEVETYFEKALRHALPGTRVADALGAAPETILRQVQDWLRAFRTKHPRVLIGKVARWLRTALYAMSHDHVAVHLLTAVESDPVCPAAYYRSPRAVDLQKLHRKLIASTWTGEVSQPATPSVRVGSWWFPAEGELKRLYSRAFEVLLARAQDRTLPLWRRHRSHQVMSVLNVVLGTALRRVSDPGESLEMFDLDRALGVLDDKSGGPTRGHRVVPLAHVVVDQFKRQAVYLRQLAAILAPQHPRTAAAILAMLARPESRIAPYFFLLDLHQGIRSLEPKDIEDELGELWPLPLNFARHWLSTALRERGVDDATICSFLGHVLLGTQNLSPLGMQAAEAHYTAMRPRLMAVLRDAGLRAFEAVVAEPGDPTATPIPGHLDAVRPLFEFGSARRARARELDEQSLRQELDDFLCKHVADRNLKSLNRKQVDALFATLNELAPNATSYRAYRLRIALRDRLAAVARRHQKDWLLPSVEIGLADFQIAVEADAFTAARRVSSLRSALAAALRGNDQGDASAPAPERFTIGLLSLALAVECLVLDYPVLRSWILQPSLSVVGIPTVADASAGIALWIRMPVDGVGTRLHPIQPWLVRAIAAGARQGWTRNDLKSVDRELARFASEYRLDWLAGGLKTALHTVRAAASLELSGLVLSFADGTHRSVSLPNATMERLVLGAVSPATREAMAQESQARTDTLDIQIVTDDQAIKHTAVSRDLKGIMAFMDMVGGCFESAAKFTTTKAQRMAFGATRVKFLSALVKEKFAALEEHTAVPPICGHLAGWLSASCAKGARLKGKKEGTYSFRSLQTYWSNLARRLIEQVDIDNIAEMDAVEIEEIYRDLLEFAETDRLSHIYAALRVFHAHMMRRHGVPGIEWAPLAALAGSGPGKVDANLVLECEYLDALRLLRTDPKADSRQQLMQAAVLILCFRGGLRIGEAIGLRRKDIACVGGVWIVRIAKNLYRNIKTDTSLRVVPILERLDLLEQETLQAWVAHADEYLDGRSTTALFTRTKGDRSMVPRSRMVTQLRAALQQATGDPSVRVHHCRHGLPNRLIAVCTSARTSGNAHLAPLMQAWPEAIDLLSVLTQQEVPTRRLLWAIANLMGHTPRTLLRSYWHLGGELLGSEVRRRWWGPQAQDAHAAEPLPEAAVILHITARSSTVPAWPKEVQREEALTAELVDRTIDMLRRHERADGIADALLIAEHQVQEVAAAANDLVQECRGVFSERSDWWFDGKSVEYSLAQVNQVHRSLDVLARAITDEGRVALMQLAECLDDRQHMVMVETPRQFKRFSALLQLLVENVANVELVLPTQTTKRLSKEERAQASVDRVAPKRGRPPRDAPEKPLALGDGAWAPWIRLAEARGFSQTRRSHLLSSRGGGRNRKVRQLRVGLRIRLNGDDRVHDAKTAARILTSAAVWQALVNAREDEADATATFSLS